VFGQITTIVAQVTPVSPGAGQPTGTVTLSTNGAAIRTATVDPATGQATFSALSIPFGILTVQASYSGDNNFQASESSVVMIPQVTRAGTQSIVTAEAVRNSRGQLTAVELVAQVLAIAPGSGVPTGTVAFVLNGNTFKVKTLSNGTAFVKVKPIRSVGKFLFVRYSGDANFQASVPRSQIINQKTLKNSARPLTAFLDRRHARG
jgi:hypothetical protein